jgi:hypothetical protein
VLQEYLIEVDQQTGTAASQAEIGLQLLFEYRLEP